MSPIGNDDGEATEALDDRFTFEGYRRQDGSIGARDHLLVVPSVICSHVVADRIAEQVTGAKSATHDHGCAQMGRDNEQTERTLRNVAANPNVAGTLVVGLGCEHVRSGDVEAHIAANGGAVDEVVIQDLGGTEATIEAGVDAASDLLESTASERAVGDLSGVTVGVVGSDLSRSTVSTAAPLVGEVVDRILEAGGRAIAAGIEPIVAHPEAARSVTDEDVITALDGLIERHAGIPGRETRVQRAAAEMDFQTATRAWGNRGIVDVLEYGERARHDAGLAVVDAPSQVAEAATGLAAAGAQVIVHATEEGVPTGNPISPVVKVTGNDRTYSALEGDIDVDANESTVEDLLEYVQSVLDGRPARAEEHGLEDFAITRIGPST